MWRFWCIIREIWTLFAQSSPFILPMGNPLPGWLILWEKDIIHRQRIAQSSTKASGKVSMNHSSYLHRMSRAEESEAAQIFKHKVLVASMSYTNRPYASLLVIMNNVNSTMSTGNQTTGWSSLTLERNSLVKFYKSETILPPFRLYPKLDPSTSAIPIPLTFINTPLLTYFGKSRNQHW